jgi:O-antigen/teichoic acid export membrane protein
VSRYILALVVLAFCLAGLLSWVVIFVLPPKYDAVRWIVVSCLGFPLLYTLSETTVVGIGISRRTGFAMLAAASSFAINLVGNWLLIPHYGAAGAAVSTCVSFWVFFLLRTEFSIYLWKSMPRLLLYAFTLACVSGAVVFTLWGESLKVLMAAYWVLLLSAAAYTFKGEVRDASAFVLQKGRAAKVSRGS